MDKLERGLGRALMGFPALPPHHLVQSNPVPGAAGEVWSQRVVDKHSILHGPQALWHQGDQWDRYQWLQLYTGIGKGLTIHSIIPFSEINVLIVLFQHVRVRGGAPGWWA